MAAVNTTGKSGTIDAIPKLKNDGSNIREWLEQLMVLFNREEMREAVNLMTRQALPMYHPRHPQCYLDPLALNSSGGVPWLDEMMEIEESSLEDSFDGYIGRMRTDRVGRVVSTSKRSKSPSRSSLTKATAPPGSGDGSADAGDAREEEEGSEDVSEYYSGSSDQVMTPRFPSFRQAMAHPQASSDPKGRSSTWGVPWLICSRC